MASATTNSTNGARRSELPSSHCTSIRHLAIVLILAPCLVGLVAVNCDSIRNHSLVRTIGKHYGDDNNRANGKIGHTEQASEATYAREQTDESENSMNRISARLGAPNLVTKYEPVVLSSDEARPISSSGGGQRAPRLTRAAGRSKTGRIQLAQRPKSTTTPKTTTASESTIVESEPSGKEADVAAQPQEDADKDQEESSDSGDYEDIEPSSKSESKSKSKAAAGAKAESGAGKKVAQSEADANEAETESGDEDSGNESEEEGADETTTSMTTTTTQRATSARKPDRSGRKEAASKNRGAVQKAASGRGASERAKSSSKQSTKATTKAPAKEAAEKGARDETEEAERRGAADVDDDLDAARQRQQANETSEIEAKTADSGQQQQQQHPDRHHHRKKPLVALPFIRQKNTSSCTPEAYLEFPRDLIGDKWRSRGLILVHVFVVCYMFYSLALVCERYFMPSLEEFAQRLQISEDVAGATLMSAGSSAPELFTAILGVFVAKGDVGTGAIVGSAVFNILFVIGICAFVSTTTAQLQWWPVLRDSVYYTFTVLVLILIIYDERITALESASMIGLYGVYIAIMVHNETLKELVTRFLLSHPLTAKLISSSSMTVEGPDDVFGGNSSSGSAAGAGSGGFFGNKNKKANTSSMATTIMMNDKTVEEDSIYLAACLVIVHHKRLFKCNLRFQSAARYIIVKRQHRVRQQQQQAEAAKLRQSQNEEVNYFGPESEPLNSSQRAKMEVYAKNASLSKNKFSIVSKDDYEFWHRPPEEGENYYLWLAKIPVNYMLHYTIPDCTLYPDKYVLSFFMSILWTAFFSYIMVWMVTIIGYTLGIPDSVMGVTFLAAGTSVPDCYSSIHAARNGMADMAVSNSIGSNVFDILIGLAVPWFIQSAIYPGVVATINSRGVIYSVILLFLSLIVTIYLMNRCDWNLQPRLGLALIIAYAVFIILTCMLEFNLFGHVNPPACPPAAGENY